MQNPLIHNAQLCRNRDPINILRKCFLLDSTPTSHRRLLTCEGFLSPAARIGRHGKRTTSKSHFQTSAISSREQLKYKDQEPRVVTSVRSVSGANDFLIIRRERPSSIESLDQFEDTQDGKDKAVEAGDHDGEQARGQAIYDGVVGELSTTQSSNDYLDHLDRIRNQNASRVLTRVEFKALKAQLHNGFTSRHLHEYYKRGETTRENRSTSAPLSVPFPFKSRTAWIPGGTPFQLKLSSKRVRRSKNHGKLPKKAYIDLIVEEKWGLESDAGGTIGEIDLLLSAHHLDLLLNTHDMKELSDRFDAKILAAPAAGRLRIVSTRASSELFLQEIARLLSNVSSMTVAVHKYKAALFPGPRYTANLIPALVTVPGFQGIFDNIAASSGTVIDSKKFSNHNQQLQIHYLGPQTFPADGARRQIIQAIGTAEKAATKVFYFENSKSFGTVKKASDFESDSHPAGNPVPDLPVRLRTLPWFRYITSKDSQKTKPLAPKRKSLTYFPKKLLSEISETLSSSQSPSKQLLLKSLDQEHHPWHLASSDRVRIGRMLHLPRSHRYVGQNNDSDSSKQSVLEPVRLAFSEGAPGLMSAIESFEAKGVMKRNMIIRCIPSPLKRISAQAMQDLPRLEFSIPIGEHGSRMKKAPVSLKAYMSNQKCGVMLPHATADLQIQRSTYFDIRNPEELHGIQDFLDQSRLLLSENGKLDTLSGFDLPVPKELMPDQGELSKTVATYEGVLVPYLVYALELTESFDFDYRGLAALEYIQKEGGMLGGRGASVSISSDLSHPDYDLKGMLGTCKSLVEDLRVN